MISTAGRAFADGSQAKRQAAIRRGGCADYAATVGEALIDRRHNVVGVSGKSDLSDNVIMSSPNATMSPFAAIARPMRVATCIAAGTFLLTCASHAQVGQAPPAGSPVPGNGQQNPAPVNPGSASCGALKDQLKVTGQLNILSGPKGGWGDTFYGPAVPRCEFWQMPMFTYVRAADGLCGLGYICIDKLSLD